MTVPIYNQYVVTVPIYNMYVISDVGSNFSMGGLQLGKEILRRVIDKLSLLTCLERVQPLEPPPPLPTPLVMTVPIYNLYTLYVYRTS